MPTLKDALSFANELIDNKVYEKAHVTLNELLQQVPNDATAHYLLGKLNLAVKDYQTAIKYCKKAIILSPTYHPPYLVLFNIYSLTNQPKYAIKTLQHALKLTPDNKSIHITYLHYLYKNYYFEKGIKHAKKIEKNFCNNKYFYNLLGLMYRDTGSYDYAATYFNKALILDPNYFEAMQNGVQVYKQTGQLTDAIPFLKKCLTLNADYIPAYIDLMDIYIAKKQINKAKNLAHIAFTKKPDDPVILASYMRIARYACDWKMVDYLTPKLNKVNHSAINQNILAPERPWLNITRRQNLKENYDIAYNAIAHYIINRINDYKIDFVFNTKPKSTINIGFLSNDFFDHATMHLLGDFFKNLQHPSIKIFALSYTADMPNDSHQIKVKKQVDYYINLNDLNYEQAAQKIYTLGIDILIDMKGFTQGSQLEIVMQKPAPIMLQFLGYPGTMGSVLYDYIITDKIVTPPEDAAYYSEQFLYLPHTYQVTDNQAVIADVKFTRQMFNLPQDALILASFNNSFKIEQNCFEVWLEILKKHDNTVLWIHVPNNAVKQQLIAFAQQYNQTHERIYFAKNLSKSLHLARIQLVDLVLDTFTCNGHTTTSDALWAGVPVITLKGKHFCSRVSASLLHAMTLPELVTENLADYQACISFYCTHPEKLLKLKQKVQSHKHSTALFDSQAYAKHFRSALWKAYRNYFK